MTYEPIPQAMLDEARQQREAERKTYAKPVLVELTAEEARDRTGVWHEYVGTATHWDYDGECRVYAEVEWLGKGKGRRLFGKVLFAYGGEGPSIVCAPGVQDHRERAQAGAEGLSWKFVETWRDG